MQVLAARRRLSLLIFVAMAMIAGCRSEQVRSGELAGVWKVESRCGARPPTHATTLTLDPGGDFTAVSVPTELMCADGPINEFLSGTGSWSLIGAFGKSRVLLRFKTLVKADTRSLPFGTEMFTEKRNSQVYLFYFLGDPDENQRVIFSKR